MLSLNLERLLSYGLDVCHGPACHALQAAVAVLAAANHAEQVDSVQNVVEDDESTACRLDVPHVWRRCDLGPCCGTWDVPYLQNELGDLSTSFHVSDSPALNFEAKNFRYEKLDFRSALSRMISVLECTSVPREYIYYRATNIARKPTTLGNTLAPIQNDFRLPATLVLPADGEPYSTVLRLCSAGTLVWLHYDVCDNVLCQVSGRKRVVLFPPDCADKLALEESSSRLGARMLAGTDELNAILKQSQAFAAAWSQRFEVELKAGDVLRIPALWGHCTQDLPLEMPSPHGSARIGISVNVFYKTSDLIPYYSTKDPWCNVDYTPYVQAVDLMEKTCDKLESELRLRFFLRVVDRIQQDVPGHTFAWPRDALKQCDRADVSSSACAHIWKSIVKCIKKVADMPNRVSRFYLIRLREAALRLATSRNM